MPCIDGAMNVLRTDWVVTALACDWLLVEWKPCGSGAVLGRPQGLC